MMVQERILRKNNYKREVKRVQVQYNTYVMTINDLEDTIKACNEIEPSLIWKKHIEIEAMSMICERRKHKVTIKRCNKAMRRFDKKSRTYKSR